MKNIDEEKIDQFRNKLMWELSKEETPEYIIFSNGNVSAIIGDSFERMEYKV